MPRSTTQYNQHAPLQHGLTCRRALYFLRLGRGVTGGVRLGVRLERRQERGNLFTQPIELRRQAEAPDGLAMLVKQEGARKVPVDAALCTTARRAARHAHLHTARVKRSHGDGGGRRRSFSGDARAGKARLAKFQTASVLGPLSSTMLMSVAPPPSMGSPYEEKRAAVCGVESSC
jgi:hypothetical protein